MIRIQLYKSLVAASGHIALEVDIEVEKNAFIAIHGPSGSGKTTLLRLIAGLLKPEKGYIDIEGKIWLDTNQNVFVPPQQRNIGLVFQDYALFPNMTVRENLNFALKKNQSPKIVDELMEMSELTGLAQRRPQQLSGGQQQRVALARALVQQPSILLMDEPLSALDPEMRAHLQGYIRKTHQTFNLTTILVSHDVNEIVRMADRVLLMENGQIKQSGSAEEVLLEKTTGERFQISGTLSAVFTKEGILYGKINIGPETIEIPLISIEASQLKVGDKVMLSASSQESRVTKA